MVNGFLFGIYSLSFAACGLLFLKFWKRSRVRFFLYLSVSFGLLAAERVVFLLVHAQQENELSIYLIRLSAFVLLSFGILDHNRHGFSLRQIES